MNEKDVLNYRENIIFKLISWRVNIIELRASRALLTDWRHYGLGLKYRGKIIRRKRWTLLRKITVDWYRKRVINTLKGLKALHIKESKKGKFLQKEKRFEPGEIVAILNSQLNLSLRRLIDTLSKYIYMEKKNLLDFFLDYNSLDFLPSTKFIRIGKLMFIILDWDRVHNINNVWNGRCNISSLCLF